MKFSIKTIILLCFALSLNAYADYEDSITTNYKKKRLMLHAIFDDSSSSDLMNPPPEKVQYDTNKAGMIRTEKIIQNINFGKKVRQSWSHVEHNKESITTIYDKKGNLLFHRHNVSKNGLLLQTTEDGVVLDVVSGDTKCDFKIIDSSEDTIFIHLDPIKMPKRPQLRQDEDAIFFKHLKVPKVLPENKYDGIIYNRWTMECQYAYLKQENSVDISDSNLSSEEKLGTYQDADNNALSYKYYAMIAVFVALACVVIARKRREVGK